MFRSLLLLCLALGSIAALACSSSGEGGRVVDITLADDGCAPASINATPGEKLNLKVKNDTGSFYEIEGIEGTQLEEVFIPEGRTRELGYNVPDGGGMLKVKCYVPAGVSTIIEIRAGAGVATAETGAPTATSGATDGEDLDATVKVDLVEYAVDPDVDSVDAGKIRFEATNSSASLVHELAVLKVTDGGTLENLGEIEDIEPGAGGAVVIDLDAGDYQLACLLVPGEAGSTVDHYQQGMHTDFTVE